MESFDVGEPVKAPPQSTENPPVDHQTAQEQPKPSVGKAKLLAAIIKKRKANAVVKLSPDSSSATGVTDGSTVTGVTVLENTVLAKTLQDKSTSEQAVSSRGGDCLAPPQKSLKRPMKASAAQVTPALSPDVIVHGEPTAKLRLGRRQKPVTNLEEFLTENETLLESCKAKDIKRTPKPIQECE